MRCCVCNSVNDLTMVDENSPYIAGNMYTDPNNGVSFLCGVCIEEIYGISEEEFIDNQMSEELEISLEDLKEVEEYLEILDKEDEEKYNE